MAGVNDRVKSFIESWPVIEEDLRGILESSEPGFVIHPDPAGPYIEDPGDPD